MWDVTTTVLAAIIGSAVGVSAVYGIHAYLVPHLRCPKQSPDFTLPRTRRPVSQQLQHSLYSLPSLNYIDPRNSIADTDLHSRRWSTDIPALSGVTSLATPTLPRSPAMYLESVSSSTPLTPTHTLQRSDMTLTWHAPPKTSLAPAIASRDSQPYRRRKARSQTLPISGNDEVETPRFTRERSKSDSFVLTNRGLLAHSHASLYRSCGDKDLSSPTASTFSGTTVLQTPPSTKIDPASAGHMTDGDDRAMRRWSKRDMQAVVEKNNLWRD